MISPPAHVPHLSMKHLCNEAKEADMAGRISDVGAWLCCYIRRLQSSWVSWLMGDDARTIPQTLGEKAGRRNPTLYVACLGWNIHSDKEANSALFQMTRSGEHAASEHRHIRHRGCQQNGKPRLETCAIEAAWGFDRFPRPPYLSREGSSVAFWSWIEPDTIASVPPGSGRSHSHATLMLPQYSNLPRTGKFATQRWGLGRPLLGSALFLCRRAYRSSLPFRDRCLCFASGIGRGRFHCLHQ